MAKNLDQFRDCLGKTLNEAKTKHPNFIFRVIRTDNDAVIGTKDYRVDRVNVITTNGIISEIVGIG